MEEQAKATSLFKVPSYLAWFGADTFLLAGSAVHWIVVSVMAYQLSGSVTVAGWFATARGVMSVVTQVAGGTFIDRHDHRLLILFQAGSCCALWLAMGVLFVLGRLSFAWFAVLCLTASAIFGFLDGTSNAALIRVVGPARYAQAESLNQGRDAAVRTAGSPLGAALFGLSQALPFFASALCDACAFVCALFLRLPDDGGGVRASTSDSSFLRDLIDGWRWVFASRTIVSAVLVISLSEFGAFALHQAVNLTLVEQGVEPLLISLANVGTALGTILGSMISMRVCERVPVGRGVIAILLAMAAANIPMAVWGNYPSVIVSTFLNSLPMPLFAALTNGFVFSKTPIDKQGRTRAAVMTTIMAFGSASGAVAGELLPRMGFSGFVLLVSALIMCSALVCAALPRLHSLPASPHWGEVEL